MAVLVTFFQGRNANETMNDTDITYYSALIERWQKKIIDATFISVYVCQLSFFSLLISTLNNEDDEYLTQLSNINRSGRCIKEKKKLKLTIIFDPLQRTTASGSPFLFLLLFNIKLFFYTTFVLCVCVCVRNRSYTVWCSDEQLFFYLFSSSQQPQKIWYLFCLFDVVLSRKWVCVCDGM